MNTDEYRVSEVALYVGRVPHTIRQWEQRPDFPNWLRPKRDERGWRVWTWDQIEGMKQWLVDEDIRPGKALERR